MGLEPGALDKIAAAAEAALGLCDSYTVFDSSGQVLAARPDRAADAQELRQLSQLQADRDQAIYSGLVLHGSRYEVHRHHIEGGVALVYGRSMASCPEDAIGAALCTIDAGVTGHRCCAFVTYRLPLVSAKVVPLLQRFVQDTLAAGAAAAAT